MKLSKVLRVIGRGAAIAAEFTPAGAAVTKGLDMAGKALHQPEGVDDDAPETLREIAAHPGEWLVDGEIVGLYFEDDRDTDLRARLTNEGVTYRDASARLWLKHAAEERRRWVAIDAEGRPCAWPVVSG